MPRAAAVAGLALGLLIALAANLTYAIPRGPVTVGLGLIAPLVLPVALYIRTTFTVAGFWQWATRELATVAVAGPAAAISYVHTYQLVLDAHEPWLLAVLAPLSSDGLAGMSTLALHRLRREVAWRPPDRIALLLAVASLAAVKPKPVRGPRPRRENPSVARPRSPARPVTSIDQSRDRRAAGMAWARANWPVTGGQIATKVGVSRSEGDRIRKWVKEEKEQAS